MRVFRATLLLAMATVLAASSGCARWTLFPKTAAPIPAPGETSQRGSRLLEAAGIQQRGAQEDANSDGRNQQVVNDLTHLDPALAMARLAERQGEPSEARRQYQRYIEKNPKHPLPHHRLGVMAAREAKYDQAEAHFRMAARLSPPTAELLSDMGYLFYLQDRLDEAEGMLRQATQMEPANHNANNNLGLVMAARGNYDHSLRQFRRVNNEGEARANLAYMLSQRGEYQRSREEYLKALTHDKSLTVAAQALLQVEEARKQEEIALAEFKASMGDQLVEPASAPAAQQQPYSAQTQWQAQGQRQPVAQTHYAPAQSAMQQQRPVDPYRATPVPQQFQTPFAYAAQAQPSANVTARPTNQQQANLLMPIPAPAEGSTTNYPTGNQSYPDTGVQLASHVEETSRFAEQPAPAQANVEVSAPAEPVTNAPQQIDHSDAWERLSRQPIKSTTSISDSGPQGDEEPAAQAPAKASGVRISIGG